MIIDGICRLGGSIGKVIAMLYHELLEVLVLLHTAGFLLRLLTRLLLAYRATASLDVLFLLMATAPQAALVLPRFASISLQAHLHYRNSLRQDVVEALFLQLAQLQLNVLVYFVVLVPDFMLFCLGGVRAREFTLTIF